MHKITLQNTCKVILCMSVHNGNARTCSTTTKTHIYFFKCACMVSKVKMFFEQSSQQTFSGHYRPNSATSLNAYLVPCL